MPLLNFYSIIIHKPWLVNINYNSVIKLVGFNCKDTDFESNLL
jgi:ABC-type tungstate transport system permease subunit